MVHRGPSGQGQWTDPDQLAALGHRRLSILDLSDLGSQPMISACGRFVISFNGEVYNYRELAHDLRGSEGAWRTGTDTEVLLQAIANWGLVRALQRVHGMFAVAVWDRSSRELTLARDRIGEKPLYLHAQPNELIFASESRALVNGTRHRLDVSPIAARWFMEVGFVPEPLSMWNGVFKLPPGMVLTIPAKTSLRLSVPRVGNLEVTSSPAGSARTSRFASACDVLASNAGAGDGVDVAADKVTDILQTVVERQLRADVPCGVFLSGGVDSSIVATLASRVSSRPLKLFTVAFGEQGFDEAANAKAIAEFIGGEHVAARIDDVTIMDAVPGLVSQMDEPTANGSYFAAALLAQVAAKDVRVCLSGDGGDEVFAGYNRYCQAMRLEVIRRRRPLAKLVGSMAALGSRSVSTGATPLGAWLQRAARTSQTAPSDALAKVARFLDAKSLHGAYLSLHQMAGSSQASGLFGSQSREGWPEWPATDDQLLAMQLFDLLFYLPADGLTKVDRASMRSSVEIRLPLLDHDLMAYALSLPQSTKIGRSSGKLVLREVLSRLLPEHLWKRPVKMGFTAPVESWAGGGLSTWIQDSCSAADDELTGLMDGGWTEDGSRTPGRNRPMDAKTTWARGVLAAWLLTVRDDRQENGCHVASVLP